MSLSPDDLAALLAAVRRLERPGLAGRFAALAGRPAAAVERALPAPAKQAIARTTNAALDRALAVALYSLGEDRRGGGARRGGGRLAHSALACASGAVGGALGLAALAVELPVSTTILLRAIAAVARAEGEDLADPRTALACLEVFALGGCGAGAEGAEAGYFAVRGLLARAVAEAAEQLAAGGLLRPGAPTLSRFVGQIAARFGVVVTEKVVAQAAMVVGAFGGAAVNLAFAEHFQRLARGHFAVRRLERRYGEAEVRAEFERLKAELAAAYRDSVVAAEAAAG